MSFKDQRALAPTPLNGIKRYSEFVQIPRVKMLLRNSFSVLYLVLFVAYFLSLTEVPSPCEWTPTIEFASLKHVFTVWTLAIFLDEMLQ